MIVPYRHPGHYRLIEWNGKLYRCAPDVDLPEGAKLVLESVAEHPEYWALVRYRPMPS